MKSPLALTGTSELLEQLSAFVPDELINHLVPPHRGRGRRITFSPAQLFRVHLLALLTPARSLNLLVRLLSEQRSWRRFAHLSHRHHVPDVWMLHQFRAATARRRRTAGGQPTFAASALGESVGESASGGDY